MATHPTTTGATATAPTCLRCARLERALSRLEGRVDILTWTVRRLAEQLSQHHLAAFLDDLCEQAESEE